MDEEGGGREAGTVHFAQPDVTIPCREKGEEVRSREGRSAYLLSNKKVEKLQVKVFKYQQQKYSSCRKAHINIRYLF